MSLKDYPQTPDGRYFVAAGKLWRCSDPRLTPAGRKALTKKLMDARRKVKEVQNNEAKLKAARRQVNAAKEALGERGPVWWDDGAPDETILSEMHDQPLMITSYPKNIKAFYMKEDPADSSKVLCMDVIAPEGVGEIIGGSQREENLDLLLASIAEHELPMDEFEWYLDLRRFGSVPHAGFGLGLERTVGWICGLEHVREAAPYPRMMSRIRP